MSLSIGIVGLPNVGKSTLFNAITSTKNAEAANYPFCTIEPNSGIVAVPDKRLDKLAEIWQTNKKTPAIVEFVDIAGLVKGASQGAGLGNKFLGHIRECDAIVHVVRCFDDDNIIHVVEDVTKAEAVDPIADIDAIDYELILSDLEVVQNRAGRMAKAAKSGNNKGAAAEAAWLQQLADHLSAGKPARSFDFDEGDAEQQTVLHEMGLLSAKPVLYACNVGEDDLMEGIENNKYVLLLILNIFLLIVGTFMDMAPALLIFTPIFLPIVRTFGMSDVQFGVMMVMNLAVGTITPPVGNVLFVGCSLAKQRLENVMKSLVPFFVAIFISLMLVTYIPALSEWLPTTLGLM